jgi:DNA-directed RNA polymerase specialized sigma24 family protein
MEVEVEKPELKYYARWTPEERGEMLMYIANGYTIMETSKEMGRSYKAIDTELKEMRAFYEAKTLPQMIYIAFKNGIIE